MGMRMEDTMLDAIPKAQEGRTLEGGYRKLLETATHDAGGDTKPGQTIPAKSLLE